MTGDILSMHSTSNIEDIETGLPDHEWDTHPRELPKTSEIESRTHWKYLEDLGARAANDTIPPIMEWGYGHSQRTSGISDRLSEK